MHNSDKVKLRLLTI